MHRTGGSEFATDNFHSTGPPVAEVPVAKNGGTFEQFGDCAVMPRLEPAQRDVAGKSLRLLGRRKGPHRLVQLPG